MPRSLQDIITHVRMVSANPAISATMIQTEDLELLCSAAEMDRDRMVEAILSAHAEEAAGRFPTADHSAIRDEIDTYRPYAERDVDAIIAAIRPPK